MTEYIIILIPITGETSSFIVDETLFKKFIISWKNKENINLKNKNIKDYTGFNLSLFKAYKIEEHIKK